MIKQRIRIYLSGPPCYNYPKPYPGLIMDAEKIAKLKMEIEDLRKKLEEREQSLPVHSARAHQFQQLEEMEEAIEEKEKLLKNLEGGALPD